MTTDFPIEVRFIRLLAKQLHQHGTAAHRLEGAVASVAERLGCRCDVFSTPTSVFLAFRDVTDPTGDTDAYPTLLLRLSPGSINLARLHEVDAIAEDVATGRIGIAEGARRLEAVPQMPSVVPLWAELSAWAVVGATVASLLGSTWTDLIAAAGLALLTGLFTLRLGGRWQEAGSFEPIVAFLVTALAYVWSAFEPSASVPNIVIGALIILMPGLDLTVAVTELSTGHLSSGTARFAGALVVLLKLALGVMLATQLMTGLGLGHGAPIDPLDLPADWFTWAAVVATGIAFAILFNARRADWFAVLVAALLSFVTSFFASQAYGSEFGVFVAALLVAGVSNLYARITSRPALTMRMPGIILLVPGASVTGRCRSCSPATSRTASTPRCPSPWCSPRSSAVCCSGTRSSRPAGTSEAVSPGPLRTPASP